MIRDSAVIRKVESSSIFPRINSSRMAAIRVRVFWWGIDDLLALTWNDDGSGALIEAMAVGPLAQFTTEMRQRQGNSFNEKSVSIMRMRELGVILHATKYPLGSMEPEIAGDQYSEAMTYFYLKDETGIFAFQGYRTENKVDPVCGLIDFFMLIEK